jgi:hypothetical protein
MIELVTAMRGVTAVTALDRVLPHPVYAPRGWVAILNPGERTGALARGLLAEAHDRARERHRSSRA